MKYLIVGLGNPGAEYEWTRHNIGFEILDALAEKFQVKWKDEMHGYITEVKHKGRTFILLKPFTYMNLSGKAVRYWMQKSNVSKENILVVLDDLALPLGKLRLRGKGSDGGHNGLKSIDQLTGGNDYARLRVGIGNDFHKGQQVNFVLGKWTEGEKADLGHLIPACGECILSFGTVGIEFTMNNFNTK